LTTLIVCEAGTVGVVLVGVLVDVESSDVDPVSEPESSLVVDSVLSAVEVDCALLWDAAVVCVAVDDDDESLPLSSPPRRTTKMIRRTARPPRTIEARWTLDNPRPGSSPPLGGGLSGVLISPVKTTGRARGPPRFRMSGDDWRYDLRQLDVVVADFDVPSVKKKSPL
jgi:hypothetical protein